MLLAWTAGRWTLWKHDDVVRQVRTPLVSVGIPAYDRPESLRRALDSIAMQDYPNLEVIVSDDCSPTGSLATVVDSYRPVLSRVLFDRLDHNVGLISNALRIPPMASGEYFLWLADDDEISPSYISSLVEVLENERDAVTAMGQWVEWSAPGTRRVMPTSSFEQQTALARMLAFAWRTDDAFFYGLHRREALLRCTFDDFWWPNAGTAMNWCYVFIADLVLQGQIRLAPDPTAQWISHNYTTKQYAVRRFGVKAVLAFAIRRVNVHFSYQVKLVRSVGWWTPVVGVPVSIASLVREFVALLPQAPRRLQPRPATHST